MQHGRRLWDYIFTSAKVNVEHLEVTFRGAFPIVLPGATD